MCLRDALFDGHAFAWKAWGVHSLFSSDSDSRCRRYSSKSACDSSSISSVSTPYSSPRTHRTMPVATSTRWRVDVATVTDAGCGSTERVRALGNRLSRVANHEGDLITLQCRTR